MTQKQALQELDSELKELTSTPIGRRLFLANIGFLLASCASVEKTRYREGDNSGQAAGLTPEEERSMTNEVLPKMRQDYPPLRDPGLQSYISGLGNKLIASNQLSGNPYRYSFTVVDVPYVNAFALPAGTVFVTAPLIAMADTEAELMGVIGHEVGHIQARHTAERMYQQKQQQKKTLWYALGGGVLGGAVGYGVGKLVCPPKDKRCLQRSAELGAVAGLGGGLLIQKYSFMAHSREDEMEADRIGFRTALRTGYDKDAIGLFYSKLLQMEKQSKANGVPILASVADAMSTHPPSEERVRQMKEMASQVQNPSGAIESTQQFSEMRRRAQVHADRAKNTTKSS